MRKSNFFGYLIIVVLLACAWMSLHASTSAAVPAMILTDTPPPTPTATSTPTATPTPTATSTPTATPKTPTRTPETPTSTPYNGNGNGTPTPTRLFTLPETGQGAVMPLLVLLVVGVGLLGLARLRHSHLR